MPLPKPPWGSSAASFSVHVVDPSVWVSRFVPADVHHIVSRDWLRTQIHSGMLVVVPSIVLAEVSGALSRRTRVPSLGLRVASAIRRIPGLRLVSVGGALAQLAADVAANRGMRGADAVYVALVSHLNLPLVTWDQEQLERSGRDVVAINPTASPHA